MRSGTERANQSKGLEWMEWSDACLPKVLYVMVITSRGGEVAMKVTLKRLSDYLISDLITLGVKTP